MALTTCRKERLLFRQNRNAKCFDVSKPIKLGFETSNVKRRFWYTEYVYNFLLKGFPETDIITTEHNCCFKFIYRRDDQ